MALREPPGGRGSTVHAHALARMHRRQSFSQNAPLQVSPVPLALATAPGHMTTSSPRQSTAPGGNLGEERRRNRRETGGLTRC